MPTIIPIPAFADNYIWLMRPFLRVHEAPIRAAVEHHAGRAPDGPVEVFAELRAWKNGS
jgi:hypothetical protein